MLLRHARLKDPAAIERVPMLLIRTAAIFILASTVLHGQTFKEGTWTGTASYADGTRGDVSLEVWAAGDELGLTVTMLREVTDATDVRVRDGVVQFVLAPGSLQDVDLACLLQLQPDGRSRGGCSPPGGPVTRLDLNPPEE